MDTVRRRIVAAFARERMRPPNGRLLVACSGGPDSSTLLDALAALRDELGLTLEVASVDHGLRPEAAAEVANVVERARSLGLPAHALAVRLERPSMAAARRARYDALLALATARRGEAIAVAHTATDQVETLLDRMLRGAGTRGLGAMAPVRPCGAGVMLIRPLLDVTAAEVEGYVAARGLAVARDPTNGDRRYRRARLRHDLLPLLRRERPDLEQALGSLAARLRADAAALDHAAAVAERALLRPEGGLDVTGLLALAPAVVARLLARAAGGPLEAVHVAAIRGLLADARGTRAVDLPGGRVAERRYDRLCFGPRRGDPGDVEVAVRGPGRYRFLERTIEVAALDPCASGSLVLRNVRPGDAITRPGGRRKVHDLWVDAKVPRPERRRLPLLVRRPAPSAGAGDEVLWVAGICPSSDLVPEVCSLTGESGVQ